jgi:flagella basal body P-ring formation protein FlgA
MRSLTLLGIVLTAAAVRAGPVIVELPERATVRTSVVAIGDVARVSGGNPAVQRQVAALDIAEVTGRAPDIAVSRKAVEYRIRLAGIDPAEVTVLGADRVGLSVSRRAVTAEEVVAAAKAELVRVLPADGLTIELTRPVTARLPEIPIGEAITVSAKPRTRVTGPGPVQMDTTISMGSERLLGLAVYLEVRLPDAGAAVMPAGGRIVPAVDAKPAAAVAPVSPVVVKARQRVTILARAGEFNVTCLGEAQQDGRVGQTIPVQNVDSKKVLAARVTGPGAVEVELGGVP